jgi:3-oxoadipate CoA-transferase, alpha subunit
MINKIVPTLAAALAGIKDGMTILCSGFGGVGEPQELMNALIEQRPRELIVVANNAGVGDEGLAGLIKAGCVRKIICNYPRTRDPHCFDEAFRAGKLELELLPQGTMSERMRAGAAGIAAFYTRVSAGTEVAKGKEVRVFDGHPHVLEHAIRADVALIKGHVADRWGNIVYRKSARNFNPTMAMGAALTIAQVSEIVGLGTLDPENIHTPGIFVDRVVAVVPGVPA